MELHLHQTHHTIGDFAKIVDYLQDQCCTPLPGLHLLPELFLTGYPLQDLCLQKPFIKNYQETLANINQWSVDYFRGENIAFLMGGLKYTFDPSGLPRAIENVIYLLQPGLELQAIYSKRLLPNYDIFDEEKYFSPGHASRCFTFQGKNIGLLICEDMWTSSFHQHDPVKEFARDIVKTKKSIDLVINLSASPYYLDKQKNRIARGMEISHLLKAPFAYVNRVGGEDEILFDGASFIVQGEEILVQGQSFRAEIISTTVPIKKPSEQALLGNHHEDLTQDPANTWEGLFSPNFSYAHQLPTLPDLTDEKCASLIQALGFGMQEYATKTGFNKFLIALSGGIDSALVVALVKLSLRPGQSLECLYMPSKFSAQISHDLSAEMCQKIQVPLKVFPIKFLHSTVNIAFQEAFGEQMHGLTDENIQSRLRGALLYGRSNQTGRMVFNTSNKSELAVGYSTQYGDSVGALSVLGDLYKTEVISLCRYINKYHENIIPQLIIDRPPSAELREQQEDAQSLPPYARLDAILEGILSYRLTLQEIVAMGFESTEVEKIYGLYQKSEYKRTQFCPILKVKTKSFGFGYRVPIAKKLT